jgi:hypothetical protein
MVVGEEACTARFVLGERTSGFELVIVFVGKSDILRCRWGQFPRKRGDDERLRVLPEAWGEPEARA